MAQQSDVPASRTRRLLHLGALAGGIAGGALSEGLRQISSGGRPALYDLLLTPANAKRLASRLAEMRGAAMKVGQLLSMEAGEFLPREFTELLARLRDDAHSMSMLQINSQLERAWGTDWPGGFTRFFFQSVAAASIGQVHRAVARDGRELAVKIQYPGIRTSIDSDVDNVATLLRLFRLVPDPAVLDDLLREAKAQLHAEADYLGEARLIETYGAKASELPGVRVPRVDAELTRDNVLVMDFIAGQPIDALVQAPPRERNAIATRLIDLFLREVLEWGLVQTDPNFSNYLYLEETGEVGLLDFGATRHYAPERTQLLRTLMAAAIDGNRQSLEQAAQAVGYIGDNDRDHYRSAIISLLLAAAEPARSGKSYDFGASDLARRMSEQLLELRIKGREWRMPPAEVLFLHRKLGGLYMLCTRLAAVVDVGRLVAPRLQNSPAQ